MRSVMALRDECLDLYMWGKQHIDEIRQYHPEITVAWMRAEFLKVYCIDPEELISAKEKKEVDHTE
jgi:hypothetical protein